jgi:hypothetical protein
MKGEDGQRKSMGGLLDVIDIFSDLSHLLNFIALNT